MLNVEREWRAPYNAGCAGARLENRSPEMTNPARSRVRISGATPEESDVAIRSSHIAPFRARAILRHGQILPDAGRFLAVSLKD